MWNCFKRAFFLFLVGTIFSDIAGISKTFGYKSASTANIFLSTVEPMYFTKHLLTTSATERTITAEPEEPILICPKQTKTRKPSTVIYFVQTPDPTPVPVDETYTLQWVFIGLCFLLLALAIFGLGLLIYMCSRRSKVTVPSPIPKVRPNPVLPLTLLTRSVPGSVVIESLPVSNDSNKKMGFYLAGPIKIQPGDLQLHHELSDDIAPSIHGSDKLVIDSQKNEVYEMGEDVEVLVPPKPLEGSVNPSH